MMNLELNQKELAVFAILMDESIACADGSNSAPIGHANSSDPFWTAYSKVNAAIDALKREKCNLFNDELYAKFIEKWGEQEIFEVTVGECGEFAALIGKRAQGRLTDEMVIDETADVLNMVYQVAMCIGLEKVQARMKEKQERTRLKLEED